MWLTTLAVSLWPIQLDTNSWWAAWWWVAVVVYAVAVSIIASLTRYGKRCEDREPAGTGSHYSIAFWTIGVLLLLGIVPGLVAVWYFSTHDPPCVERCPHCKKSVRKWSTVCRHCERELSASA